MLLNFIYNMQGKHTPVAVLIFQGDGANTFVSSAHTDRYNRLIRYNYFLQSHLISCTNLQKVNSIRELF